MVNDVLTAGLGVAGFGLILWATTAKVRRRLLITDMLGTLLVAVHYLLLGAGAGAALSMSYAAADACGLAQQPRVRQVGAGVAFGGAAVVTCVVELTAVGMVALVGSAIAIGARTFSHPAAMLLGMGLSTTLWGAYGVLSGSVPQVLFSAVYCALAVRGWWRLSRVPTPEGQDVDRAREVLV